MAREHPGRLRFGDGEMAGRVREFDWAGSPAGAIEAWPPELQAAVEIMLASPMVASMAVGPSRLFIYNDAAAAVYGARHPAVLGLPMAEAFADEFPKVADVYDRAFAGEGVHVPAQPLDPAERGEPEIFDAYVIPVRNAAGVVIAAYAPSFAIGDGLRAQAALRAGEDRQASLLKLSDALRKIDEPGEIQRVAMCVLGEQLRLARAYYFDVQREPDGGWVHVIERGYQRDPAQMEFVGPYALSGFNSDLFEGFARGEPIAVSDIETLQSLTEAQRAAYRDVGVAAFINVPLMRDGSYAAGIGAHDGSPRTWTEDEIDLIREVAARTWTASERATAQAALRATEAEYRTLFETMEQGFCIIEKLSTAPGQPSDYRYIAANPAFERQTGLTDAVGRTVPDLFPGAATTFLDRYDDILETGRNHSFEDYTDTVDRWVEVEALPTQTARQVAVLFTDISASKRAEAALRQSEKQQAFLLKLSDDIRAASGEEAIGALVTRRLSEHLRLDRCYLAQLFPEEDRVIVGPEHRRPDLRPAAGEYRLSDFPEVVRRVQTQTVVFENVATDDVLTGSDKTALGAMDIAAFVTAGVRRGEERVLWSLIVTSASPRSWSPGEVALVEETAERTWAAVEQARAEAALRQSEAKYRSLFESMNEGFAVNQLVRDQDGAAVYIRFLELNPAYERQTGFDRGRSVGQLASILIPGFLTAFLEVCERVVRTGAPERFERFAEDTDRWFVFHVTPLASTDMFAVFYDDITQRKHAEASLRESEERLRQFGEASQDILWIRDAKTLQWTYLTPAFETIYGLTRDQALTGDDYRNWQDLILPEDRDYATTSIARVRKGEWVTFEFRVRRPSDGAIRWLRNTDFPITDAAGEVILIGGIGHDFTDVREAELRLKTLVEGIPQLVWRAIDGGQWTWANPQWTDYTGQSAVAYVERGWLDALHPDDRAVALEAWDRAIAQGGFEVEYRLRSSDGEYRWFQTRTEAVRDPLGGVIEWLGTSTDVQDLRALKDRQQVLLHELQHRVRNLLAVIRSIAARTADNSETVGELGSHLEGRLGALARTQMVLTQAPGEGVGLEMMVRDELLAQAADETQLRIEGPDVRLSAKAAEVLALAVHEMATNAVKYGALSAASGKVHVSWAHEMRGETPWVRLLWEESGVRLAATAPRRQGFGTELIQTRVPYELRGHGDLAFEAGGVRCVLEFPIRPGESILQTNAPGGAAQDNI